MLPVTKSVPKEMLPVANKPLIQYAVEEAAASGIDEIILVTRIGSSVPEQYFSRDYELEQFLKDRGHDSDFEIVSGLSSLAHISAVRQELPKGLGDALLCARSAVGDEPFAVVLPDALVKADKPVLAQLMESYRTYPGSYVAARPVMPQDTVRFGMLGVVPVDKGCAPETLFRISTVVEKPLPGKAPSPYGVFGRYILEPEIFDYLEQTKPDGKGEVQLADALQLCCQERTVYALCFDGRHYDAGNKLEYLQAVLEFAMCDPDLGPAIREYLATRNGLDRDSQEDISQGASFDVRLGRGSCTTSR